jgi:hypothetical protein
LGYEFQKAYFKITKLDYNYDKNKVIFTVRGYSDIESIKFKHIDPKIQVAKHIYEKTYIVDPNTLPKSDINMGVRLQLIKSAYLWLKKSSGDFKDSIDILDS